MNQHERKHECCILENAVANDGSVVVLGCGMAFSLVPVKWEGDGYSKKSCEDN